MINTFDDRRDLAIPGNAQETLQFCADEFVELCEIAIRDKGVFNVALSGGSTPKALYQLLTSPIYKSRVDWENVRLFWSDERNVLPDDPQSNYKMAMDAGIASVPIPQANIHRMQAEETDLENPAKSYEELILQLIPNGSFDLIMLGMGEDGHTASLFPKTHGLHSDDRLVIANFIPQLNIWRMSLTFKCINQARHISIYVLGKSKASMLQRVLSEPYDPDTLPIQKIGTRTHKALWIADLDAASELVKESSI